LPNYSMELGKLLTSGSDIWLNTPQPPLEASGTSGMKAALNGVPSFSILDGWWLEGCIENVTGWAIGERDDALHTFDPKLYAQKLYEKLQTTILPKYYSDRNSFINIMRHTIAINGSFFNTERMLNQYISKAYY
ncbi:MAG: glycogen/starch/alpha-glucan phosphorylase, partial [Gammaproteobacteria bacterium]|nr:glycogen/starch/alpha-glucan phosphorylase [Gammaproteobacteria bacterium]